MREKCLCKTLVWKKISIPIKTFKLEIKYDFMVMTSFRGKFSILTAIS